VTWPFDSNVILVIIGWLIGGFVVVIGMRSQLAVLVKELTLMRQALVDIGSRTGRVEVDVAFLKGLNQGRAERLVEK